MPFADLLTAERIVVLTEPGGRDTVFDVAARLLSNASPGLTATIASALRDRETVGTTAIGHGVAVPHARSNAFDHARGAFLRLQHPVDFGAGDDLPVDLVFAMNVPEHSPQLHLQSLADVAGRLADREFRDALRGARDLAALRSLLLGQPTASMRMTGS